jgi:hypothetical protein
MKSHSRSTEELGALTFSSCSEKKSKIRTVPSSEHEQIFVPVGEKLQAAVGGGSLGP